MNMSFEITSYPNTIPTVPTIPTDHHKAPHPKKSKFRRLGSKKVKSYHWTDAEHSRYIKFLLKKGELFQRSPLERKIARVNVIMSSMVGTRNPTQCHTHHQKMMIMYGSVEEIIEKETAFLASRGKVKAYPPEPR